MPATLEIAVGQTGAVTVVLDGAQEAYGIDVRGTFDPNVIELVPASPSSPLTAGGFIKPDFIVRNMVDNVAGTFQWAATQINPSAPASGSGPILIAQARGKAAGRSTSIEITSVELSDRSGSALPVTRRAGTVRVLGSEGAGTSVAPTSTPTAAGGTGATPIVITTQLTPTPTQPGKVLPGELTPTPGSVPAATSTRAATPTGQASPPAPTRTVLNVTAQPAATAGAPAAPRATIEPTPRLTVAPPIAPGTPRAPATPGATATPGVAVVPGALSTPASTPAGPAITATRTGANVVPTFAPEALAAVAQSGLAPKAPAALPLGGAAAPGNTTPPTAVSSPDPIMGFVLLAIGLAGAYGFGAADSQRRRRSK